MQTSKSRKLMLLFLTTALVLAFYATASLAQGKVKVKYQGICCCYRKGEFRGW